MLLPDTRFTLPGLPQIQLYADDQSERGFYALPMAPRVAPTEEGKPQLGLMIYGVKEGDGTGFRARGGIVSITTTLRLLPDEEGALRKGLSRLLAQRSPPAPGDPPPAADLLGLDWIDTDAEVSFNADLKLSGRPSGFGGNECSCQLKLDADQARTLRKAWDDGLPDGAIRYRGHVRAAAGSLEIQLQGPIAVPDLASHLTTI